MLRTRLDTTPALTYFVHEEEIPRAGTRPSVADEDSNANGGHRQGRGQILMTWTSGMAS